MSNRFQDPCTESVHVCCESVFIKAPHVHIRPYFSSLFEIHGELSINSSSWVGQVEVKKTQYFSLSEVTFVIESQKAFGLSVQLFGQLELHDLLGIVGIYGEKRHLSRISWWILKIFECLTDQTASFKKRHI